jgi:glutathione synthase/RimK-type ligase-like ATP-grasp enzyme
MIVTRYSHLVQLYHDLGPGDAFVGLIPATPLRAALLTDLAARGVRLLPSATAQMLSASKTMQAFVLGPWMMPHTQVITRRKALLDALAGYSQNGIAAAVTKAEHQHCGHGVHRWNDLETLYNCMSLDDSHYPFVLQPFMAVTADVRAIMVGDYCEAYARHNPHGFRMNLAAGGSSRPHTLDGAQEALCRRVMARGRMPYAHLDLIITDTGATYLSEISLNGGLHGADIAKSELDRLKHALLLRMTEEKEQ